MRRLALYGVAVLLHLMLLGKILSEISTVGEKLNNRAVISKTEVVDN